MGRGLAFSLILHGFLLAWALVSMAGTKPLRAPEIQPVEVAIVTDDDLVRLKQGSRSSKKLETKPDEAKTKPAKKISKKVRKVAAAEPPPADPPEPPEVSVKSEPPTPKEPAKDDIAAKLAALEKTRAAEDARRKAEAERRAADAKKKAEAEAKKKAEAAAKKKAEAKRKAEAERKRKKRLAEKRRRERERKRKLAEKRRKLAEKRRREREAKKKFDATDISALLNKIPDSARPPAGSQTPPKTRKPLPRGPAAGAPEGRDTRLTASQRSLLGVMMKRAVSSCWRVQTGMQGADQLVVELEVRLNPDGTLNGDPQVVNRHGGALFADAATNAIRALRQCAPYDLPEKLYKGGWDHMVVTFDPQKMF